MIARRRMLDLTLLDHYGIMMVERGDADDTRMRLGKVGTA